MRTFTKKKIPVAIALAIIPVSLATAKPFANFPFIRINPTIATTAPLATTQVVSPPLLLNDQDIQNLKNHPAKYPSIIQSCNAQLNYQPSPVAVLDLQHTATGENEISDKAKNLTQDATITTACVQSHGNADTTQHE